MTSRTIDNEPRIGAFLQAESALDLCLRLLGAVNALRRPPAP